MALVLPALIVQILDSWFYFVYGTHLLGKMFPAFYSSRDWIVLVGYLSMDFEYSYARAFPRPLVGQI